MGTNVHLLWAGLYLYKLFSFRGEPQAYALAGASWKHQSLALACFAGDRNQYSKVRLISTVEVAIATITCKGKFIPVNTLVVLASFWPLLVLSYLLA